MNQIRDNIEEVMGKIKNAYFIKLGEKGGLENHILHADMPGCIAISYKEIDVINDDDDVIRNKYRELSKKEGAITDFIRQINAFREADDTVLWITFFAQKLWWGITDDKEPYTENDFKEEYKHYTSKKLKFGWYDCDIKGELLTYEKIAGVLSAVQNYRGTICGISSINGFDKKNYLIKKLKGEIPEQLETAIASKIKFESDLINVIKLLQPKDFEYFVDLIFTRSGWFKQTPGGGVEEGLDLDLVQPLTGERAFVQIKSVGTKEDFEDYLKKCENNQLYNKFIFVYHSAEKEIKYNEKNEKNVVIINNKLLAKLSIELGLTDFLLKKVS